MTETELKQIAWDAQIESEKLQYFEDRAQEALETFYNSKTKVKELEELYYMIDTVEIHLDLQAAKAEANEARDSYMVWYMQLQQLKTGE